MDIVQKFDRETQFLANVLKHPQMILHVFFAVEVSAFGSSFGLNQGRSFATIAAHLTANIAIALLLKLADTLDYGLGRITASMAIDRRPLAALAAQELVNRHPRPLAFDIPERLINTGDGIIEHRPIAPIAIDHRHLPDLLNPIDIATNEEGLEMALDRGVHRIKTLGKSRATDPVEPIVRSDDFNDDQPGSGRLGKNRFDVFNHNWHIAS